MLQYNIYNMEGTKNMFLITNTILADIKDNINQKESIPHLLFYGVPGTGKTTTARKIIETLTQSKKGLNLEINASDNRGIDAMRDIVINFSKYPSYHGRKIVLLDESDYLTADAQATLRQPMLKYKENCMFIFTCNNINKMHTAIISRCKTYEFKPLNDEQMGLIIQQIASEKNYHVTPEKKQNLIQLARGDIRYIENNIAYVPSIQQKMDLNYIIATPLTKIYMDYLRLIEKVDYKVLLEDFLQQVLLLQTSIKRKMYLILKLAQADLAISNGGLQTVQLFALLTHIKDDKTE